MESFSHKDKTTIEEDKKNMADAIGVLGAAFAENWAILVIIVLTAMAIVPWAGLWALNFFNHNIWQEIGATFNRKKIKLMLFSQNGNAVTMYREMTAAREILVKEDKKNGNHEYITPTTPPIQDSNSHRQFYVAIEGVEGTFNPLSSTNYDVNTPMRKMGHTMSFEAGREFEKTYNPQAGMAMWLPIIQIAIPFIMIIILLVLVANQGGTLIAINEALAANTATLKLIEQSLSSTFIIGE